MHKRKSIRLRNEFLVKNSVHFAVEIHVRHVYPTILFIMPGFVQIPIIKWWIDGRTINFHVHEEQYTFLSASSYSPIFARRKRRVIKKKKKEKKNLLHLFALDSSYSWFCNGWSLRDQIHHVTRNRRSVLQITRFVQGCKRME